MKQIRRPALLLLLLLLGGAATALHAQNEFWRHLDRPYGGELVYFLTAPNGDLYTGSPEGGAYRSSDKGATWSPFGPSQTDFLVSAITRNGTIFGFTDGRGGIYRSTDNGTTWESAAGGLDSTRGTFLTETATGTLLIATRDGLYRSTDNGTNWTPSGLDSMDIRFPRAYGSMVYVATDDTGLFRSSDDGITWQSAGNMQESPIDAFVFLDSMNMFVGTDNGVFRSENGGDSFTPFALAGHGIGPFAMGRLGNGELIIGSRDSGAYRFSLEGNGSRIRSAPGDNLWGLATVDPDIIVLGYEGRGIYRSTDMGTTFEQVGIAGGASVRRFAEGPDGAIYAGTFNGLYRTVDNGVTWTDLRIPGDAFNLAFAADGTIYAAGSDAMVYRSIDNGTTWETLDTGVGNDFTGAAITSSGAVVLSSYNGLYRSTNNGTTWTRSLDGSIYGLAMAPNGTLYGYDNSGIYRSTDAGASWSHIEFGGTTSGFSPQGIAAPSNNVVILGGSMQSSAAVIRSTNQGASWVTTSLTCPDEYSYRIFEGPAETVFVLGQCGVYRSVDGGATWGELADLPENERYGTFLADNSGMVWFGGDHGIYVGSQPSAAPAASLPDGTQSSLAIFPNPTHGTATIGFHVAAAARVTLTLRTVSGESVTVVVDRTFVAGDHTIALDQTLPTGSYLLDMRVGDRTVSTMMQIVK